MAFTLRKPLTMWCIFFLAALILLPNVAVGQEPPEQPLQELFLTETVYPQEKRELQLTLSSLVDRSRSDLAAVMPFTIEYGLSNRWQIEASWDGYTQFHKSPFKHMRTARFSIGTKYSFMNIAHSRVHAAVGLDAEFPRPDEDDSDMDDDQEGGYYDVDRDEWVEIDDESVQPDDDDET